MNIAIIAAAGAGTRMASDRPKQFLLLAGTPVIFHTLKVFEQCDSIDEVIVVLPAEESAGFLSLAGKFGVRKLARVVPGGCAAQSLACGDRRIADALLADRRASCVDTGCRVSDLLRVSPEHALHRPDRLRGRRAAP